QAHPFRRGAPRARHRSRTAPLGAPAPGLTPSRTAPRRYRGAAPAPGSERGSCAVSPPHGAHGFASSRCKFAAESNTISWFRFGMLGPQCLWAASTSRSGAFLTRGREENIPLLFGESTLRAPRFRAPERLSQAWVASRRVRARG